jgi:two-component system nitrate/nitrite response regulator NarL
MNSPPDRDGMITVVIVDDHPFFRDGVARGLQQSGRIKVVGLAEDAAQGLAMIRKEIPDVALVDYQMPGLNGLDLAREVNREELGSKVLLLSAITESSVVFRALEHGAKGYLSKDARRREIVEGVIRVAKGATVVPPELAAGVADQIRRRAEPQLVLSQREAQVLRGFADGLSIPQLAAQLFIGASTVKSHTQRLYEKLGVGDRAAAVAEGMRRGLLE